MACGLWPVACGLWLVACGLWPVACGHKPQRGKTIEAITFLNFPQGLQIRLRLRVCVRRRDATEPLGSCLGQVFFSNKK